MEPTAIGHLEAARSNLDEAIRLLQERPVLERPQQEPERARDHILFGPDGPPLCLLHGSEHGENMYIGEQLDSGLVPVVWHNPVATWVGFHNPLRADSLRAPKVLAVVIGGRSISAPTVGSMGEVRPGGILATMLVGRHDRHVPKYPLPYWAYQVGAEAHYPDLEDPTQAGQIAWPKWNGTLDGSHGGWGIAPFVGWRNAANHRAMLAEMRGMLAREDRCDLGEKLKAEHIHNEYWWGSTQPPVELGIQNPTLPTKAEMSHGFRNIRGAVCAAQLGDPLGAWMIRQALWQQLWWAFSPAEDPNNPASWGLPTIVERSGLGMGDGLCGRQIGHLLFYVAAAQRWASVPDREHTILERVERWLERIIRQNGTTHTETINGRNYVRPWEQRIVYAGMRLAGLEIPGSSRVWSQREEAIHDAYRVPADATSPLVGRNDSPFGTWYRNFLGIGDYFDTEEMAWKRVSPANLESYRTGHSFQDTEMLDSIPALGGW